jgi:hypothetical protein
MGHRLLRIMLIIAMDGEISERRSSLALLYALESHEPKIAIKAESAEDFREPGE